MRDDVYAATLMFTCLTVSSGGNRLHKNPHIASTIFFRKIT